MYYRQLIDSLTASEIKELNALMSSYVNTPVTRTDVFNNHSVRYATIIITELGLI